MNVIAHMIDCASPLTATNCAGFVGAGISRVGRYIGYKSRGWSKGMQPPEVSIILAHGIGIQPIFEGDPVDAGYFTAAQGTQDAQAAIEDAEWLGIPIATPIVFTVDFPAIAQDMNAIRVYLDAVKAAMGNRKFGVYGDYTVMSNVAADAYWQTCGWSNGQISPRADIYQRAVDQTVAGVQVDLDDVYRDPGFWMPATVKPAPKPSNTPFDSGYNSGISDAIAAIGKLKK